ncbi:transglutaminaseTgpA domain-containing protein [Roseateles sp. BYS180W]|uniref:TransglutaminaseTgpA domain-containing protein n=1 Tax=Roseateles rivi TaxID=3299028 RepID=A0ABW7FYJ7_9BURK
MKPLPRESRDTLFLLATIAATLAPHVPNLPSWCTVVAVLILLWRARLAWLCAPLPPRWVLAVVVVAVVALTALTHDPFISREAGITLLVMMLGLKTLELRARRDAFVVFFLGFFVVLTQYLNSQSLLTALWTLLCCWALLSQLVLAHMPNGQPSLRQAASVAARNVLWGLPVMLLLYALFPRLPPLWGMAQEPQARTGLSSELQFGSIGALTHDDSIALRLRFLDEQAPPPQQLLYFRTQVLSNFDGRVWVQNEQSWPADLPGQAVRPQGRPRAYEMLIEPLNLRVLPQLEFSGAQPGAQWPDASVTLTRGAQLQWESPQPVGTRQKLMAMYYPQVRRGPEQFHPMLQADLALPAGLNPRSQRFARELLAQVQSSSPAQTPRAYAQALLAHINGQNYSYTLSPGTYGQNSPHLIDEFWFERRAGFCEHYASAFVVLMRAAGIPARIVTGFQGADEQLQDEHLVVRMSHAHAWAEYWVAGSGWLRADPTAVIAPERVQGRTVRPRGNAWSEALSKVSPALLQRWRYHWELLDYRWKQAVLNYDQTDQLELLQRLGWRSAAVADLLQLVVVGLCSCVAVWGLVLAWRRRDHSPWARLRQSCVRQLQALGLPAQHHQSPRHWAELAQQRWGNDAHELCTLLLELEQARYGASSGAHERPRTLGAVGGLRWCLSLRWSCQRLRQRGDTGRPHTAAASASS